MGNKLFGVDIAGLINTHVGPGVLAAVLRTFSSAPADGGTILSAPVLTPTNNDCRGFVETFEQDIEEVNGEAIQEDDRMIVLIGDSLPAGVIPAKGNEIDIQDVDSLDKTFKVLSIVERDPAAATYTIHARI